MKEKFAVAALTVLGVAWVKLYGDYKYACGMKDAGDFYLPIMDVMNNQIKDLCKKLNNN